MRASAFGSRGVTTFRNSRRRRGPERGNLHRRVRRRGKQRRADLAWRRREHLRPRHAGGSRNDKDAQHRSSQKEHTVCLHAVQIYDRSERNVSLIGLVPARFVLLFWQTCFWKQAPIMPIRATFSARGHRELVDRVAHQRSRF